MNVVFEITRLPNAAAGARKSLPSERPRQNGGIRESDQPREPDDPEKLLLDGRVLRHQAGEGRKVPVVAGCTDRCSIERGFCRITRVYGALLDNCSLPVEYRVSIRNYSPASRKHSFSSASLSHMPCWRILSIAVRNLI